MKHFKKIFAVIISALIALSCVGCANNSGPDIDESKFQIYAYAKENGVGHQWLINAAAKYNQANPNTEFEVIPQTGLKDASTFLEELRAGTCEVQLAFGSNLPTIDDISQNLLIDIADVYEMSVDSDGQKIKEKVFDFEDCKKAYSNMNGTGIYCIPYALGMNGMIFDYGVFAENDWLFWAAASEESALEAQVGSDCVEVSGDKLVCKVAFGNYNVGDRISRAGKDGKYGTYDDGQAVTMAEYEDVLDKILYDQYYGFLYPTSIIKDNYQRPIFDGVFAQTLGVDNYRTLVSFTGDLKGTDGVVQASITHENGKTAYQTDIVEKAYTNAIEFYRDNVSGLAGTIKGNAYTADQIVSTYSYGNSSMNHKEAQDKWVFDFMDTKNPHAAFFLEGCWWEYEATASFNRVEEYDGEEYGARGWGKRDYRFYLYPNQDGQVGEKSVISCQDDGCGVFLNCIPKKVKDAGKEAEYIEECKKFLAYTLNDENLAYFTAVSGVARPYDYELSNEQLAALTPFQRNNWYLSHDQENVYVLRPNCMGRTSKLRLFSGWNDLKTGNDIYRGNLAKSYTFLFDAFDGENPATTKQYVDSVLNDAISRYDSLYQTVKQYLQ